MNSDNCQTHYLFELFLGFSRTCNIVVETLYKFNILSCQCDLGFLKKPWQEVEVVKYSLLLIMFVKSKCFHYYNF